MARIIAGPEGEVPYRWRTCPIFIQKPAPTGGIAVDVLPESRAIPGGNDDDCRMPISSLNYAAGTMFFSGVLARFAV